jgi:hypothetical protein
MTIEVERQEDLHADPNREKHCITINQQIVLTTNQYELLKIISNFSNKSISEYIQKAVIETMKTEIEFGDFYDNLLEKLDNEKESAERG